MTIEEIVTALSVDPAGELSTLKRALTDGAVPRFETGLADHFRAAKSKRSGFAEHAPVLGISIGGTNSKAVLAETHGARVQVTRAKSLPNPAAKTHIYDFLDDLLLGDEVIRRVLREPRDVDLGVSIAVRIVEGVPFHRTKMPTIEGLVARGAEEDTSPLRYDRVLGEYARTRGFRLGNLFCSSDGIVAHLGSVGSSPRAIPETVSALLVCGTGLATADDHRFIPFGAYDHLAAGDRRMFPPDETEGGLFNYAVAGKGVGALVKRCLKLCSELRDAGDQLEGLYGDLGSPAGARVVARIWKSDSRQDVGERSRPYLEDLKPAVRKVVTRVCGAAMERTVVSLANCALAVLSDLGGGDSAKRTILFIEGSIARDREVRAGVEKRIGRVVSSTDKSRELGLRLTPHVEDAIHSVQLADGLAVPRDVDITVVGAAIGAICESLVSE